MVEFALILFPLLLLVAGIIQFGIGAQLLARHAAHRQPGRALGGCQQLAAGLPAWLRRTCDGPENAPADTPEADDRRRTEEQSDDQRPGLLPGRNEAAGDPVRVQIRSTFNVLPILGFGSLDLKAKATMRLEQSQDPTQGGGLITGDVPCT